MTGLAKNVQQNFLKYPKIRFKAEMIFTKKNSVISKNGLTKLKPNLDQCSVLKRKINLLSFFNKTEEKPDKKIEEKK